MATVDGVQPMDRCQLCETEFSFTTRKHNCRVCGGVFCSSCSSDKVNIGNTGLQRACFVCFSSQEHLNAEEQKVVDELCTELGEFAVMRTMVLRKRTGSNKRQHVMLVVTRYRLIRIPRSAPKSYLSWSLLDLAGISVPKPNTVLLELGKQSGEQVLEQFETAKAAQVILTLRSQHAIVCNGMPDFFQLQVNLPPAMDLALPALAAVGPAGGFIEAYRAWCNFYTGEPSEELMQFIQDSEHREPFVLSLSVCPGIESGTNVTFDLQPVFAALRHNTYYRSIELCDSVQKGAVMEYLADCLKYNRSVTRLVLRDLTTSYMSAIGNALAENRSNMIQELDFSGTQLSEKATKSLGLSLVVKEFGIRSIKLANCGMTSKSVALLFREGFLPSPDVTMMLDTLDLSDNSLGLEGSSFLQIWLAKQGTKGQLRTLKIARCGANVNQVLNALGSGNSFLEHLDIAENPLDPDTCRVLAALVGNHQGLRHLDISGCGISPLSQNQILSALLTNPNLPQLHIVNAGNLMEDASIKQLTSSFTNMANGIHTLDLSRLKMGESAILEVFQCLTEHVQSLDTLVLSDCFASISGHISGMRIGHAMADMLLQSPRLKKLTVSAQHSLGMFTSTPEHVLLPFLQRMQGNETLLQLDISGNRIGDKMAIAMAEVLRCNTTLIDLSLDKNNVSLTGFQALEYGMHRNQVLQRLSYPTRDVYKGLKALSANRTKQALLMKIVTNIQLAVHYNQHNNGIHPRFQEDVVPPPPEGPIFLNDQQTISSPRAPPGLAMPARTDLYNNSQTDWGQQPAHHEAFSQPVAYHPEPAAYQDPMAVMQAPMQPTPMQPTPMQTIPVQQEPLQPMQVRPLQPTPMQSSNSWDAPAAQDWNNGNAQAWDSGAGGAQGWDNTPAPRGWDAAPTAQGWGNQAPAAAPPLPSRDVEPAGGAEGGEWASKFGGAGAGVGGAAGGEERTSDLYQALASVLGNQ